jgi:hypothetical protein
MLGLVFLQKNNPARPPSPPASNISSGNPAALDAATEVRPGVFAYPDPTVQSVNDQVVIDPSLFEEDLFSVVSQFTGRVSDESSLSERVSAIAARTRLGRAHFLTRFQQLESESVKSRTQDRELADLALSMAYIEMYEGEYSAAERWLERALALSEAAAMPAGEKNNLRALLGVVALRRGEQDNCIACVGPSSCLFPIAASAVHTNPAGSLKAIEAFTAYLEESPGDLRARWLLNIAYMTLGKHPQEVPPRYLLPVDSFHSSADIGRFTNVATRVGLTSRAPGLAGGSVFDDFNGDSLPDLFTSSIDVDRGASLFVNLGDGSFEDRSQTAGLDAQPYALNVRAADFDNDGDLDLLLLRGGWELPTRMSLLSNNGRGEFTDITIEAGLDEPIATESAEWGDFDNDGYVDLFVCGEYRPGTPDTRNLCRLYRNKGDATFVDVAAAAGVRNDRYAKGAAWGDFDNDGHLDLFVSNMSISAPMPSRLYQNQGDGTFRDVASEMGITGAFHHFTCLFWDYDNDGWLDLLVSDYHDSQAEVVASNIGVPLKTSRHPFLYRNLNGKGFEDVSASVGLNRPIPAMSINIGDLDNDGWLDLHMGTGWMSYSGLIPDLTLKNEEGGRFLDITDSSGTGHLQKGHGVSFADWNCDGYLDFVVVLGGGYPGDKGYTALFQNPGQEGCNYLDVKLVGRKTNRSALGAKLTATLRDMRGTQRTIHRTIGNNGSFGGNSLVQHIGLSDAQSIESLTIQWPTSGSTQTFRDIVSGQSIEVTEGSDAYISVPRKPVAVPNR